MRKTPTLRLTAEGMTDRLERVSDLQSSGNPSEIADLVQLASKWLLAHHKLRDAYNRLALAGASLGIYPKSPERWRDAIKAADQLARTFKKLGDEYIDLCDVDRRDGKKCATVISPGTDHCPHESQHTH